MNNNYNNYYNNNEINLNDLESKSFEFISKLGKSYCIYTKDLKKKEIIERIRSIIKMKQIYLEEKQKDENINSFNKINKITLFEGIEIVELLFWKVFRNKTIFKKIMSFMNKQFSSSYDSIISVEKLIQFDQFGILKEKVKRNCRYLHFEDDLLTKNGYLIRLFRSIKNDKEFYRKLFKNHINFDTDFTTIISNYIIIANNIELYQLLVEEFNYEPTIDDIKLSIIRGSKKFIKYLLNQEQQQINNNNFKLSKNHLENIYDIKYNFSNYSNGLLFKGLYCFYKNYKLFNNYQSSSSIEFSTLFKIISIFEKIKQDLTLKQLITIVKLVLILINNNNNENENEQINKIYNNIKNNSTITLNNIENFKNKLNKEKLKSKLGDPINTNDNENKEFIKKLLDFHCLIWNLSNLPLSFYLGYYSLDENQLNDKMNNQCDSNTSFENSLRFANYTVFKLLTPIELQINNLCFYFKSPNILFSNCNDKNKQIEFIFNILQVLKSNFISKENFDNQNLEEQKLLLFYFIINYNDLELIKYVSNQFGNLMKYPKKFIGRFPFFITYYIKSILVLDYLFENHKDHFIFFNQDNYKTILYCFKDLNVLQHYEKMITFETKENQEYEFRGLRDYCIENFSNEINLYILSNENINYQNKKSNNPRIFNVPSFFNDIGFSNLLLENHKPIILDLIEFKDKETKLTKLWENLNFFKLLDWIYVNYSNKMKIGSNFIVDQFQWIYFLCAAGRFEEIETKSNYFKTEDPYEFLIPFNVYSKNGDLKLLDLLFKHLNYITTSPTTSDKFKLLVPDLFYEIIWKSIVDSNLKTLEFIHENYDFFLKDKETNGGILHLEYLEDLLSFSIKSNKIKIFEFLFQFIPITKINLEKIASKRLLLYFENKLNK
ncbi:hypothetical protein DDB_G0268918 [Dictyostelium discoideum AX4]|uniref:Uncharacterized protein n=1 Tax=Dictyostelium discoideum TaxID=44689 RepID=Q55F47_DICDI|nr:hypothetical protein DDB_G0268918 [Dictyostelium discoideum AX4]EAL73048.1 hypothetical protein DDB_G0268918 [Dictyostelium discoideum AX4]|eukprot:XP_646823.1 hypothetical protein DDB_G0268918 [Dictyostelium discoideum AX4]